MLIEVENAQPVKAYRGDIDGLRAIAVISVMLYHFSVWPFTGGFVGVDVFFVISGYLITGGILKDDSHHHFSFSDFYTRRARRLFPALIATIGISYAVAFFAFSPLDFEKMSASTVFALTGISNFFFWMSADYFDSASILKPLLHTWSLSVELQFYLVWPLLLIILARFGRMAVAFGAVAVTLAGFALSLYAISYDSTGAYYLTQYRFWEFAAGGLVFLFRRSAIFNRLASLHGLLFALGIALVLYPDFTYSTNTTFPGINALMPVIGSMLMILSGDKAIAGHALASRPASYIGEVSYSLYLVHWPVVVFTQYILVKEFSGIAGLLLVIASFALAIPMHRFIEKPLRKPGSLRLSGPAFCLSCAGIAMSLMATASSSWAGKGWVWRLPEAIRNINSIDRKQAEEYVWKKQKELTKKANFENNGKPKLLIIGDSQSADIINMLNESGSMNDFDILARTIIYKCGVPYIQPSERQIYWASVDRQIMKFPSQAKICDKQMDELLTDIALKKADKIYISMHWEDYSLPKVQMAIDTISSLTHAKIYLFGNKVLAKSSIDIANSFGRTTGISEYASKLRDEYSENINEKLAHVSGVQFVDMMHITCPTENKCSVLTDEMNPIFFDAAHLTSEGARFLGPRFNRLIASID